MKTGVILARLQPIHNGHLALIKKAVAENDEVYIFIGRADKFNQRNPLPISLRLQLTEEAIDFEFGIVINEMYVFFLFLYLISRNIRKNDSRKS